MGLASRGTIGHKELHSCEPSFMIRYCVLMSPQVRSSEVGTDLSHLDLSLKQWITFTVFSGRKHNSEFKPGAFFNKVLSQYDGLRRRLVRTCICLRRLCILNYSQAYQ